MNKITRRRALYLGGGAVLAGGVALGGAGLAGAESAAGEWRNLVIITANIGRDHKEHRERAIRDVRNTVKFGDKRAKPLVGWQEIRGGDEDSKELGWIDHHFGDGYRTLYERSKSPAQQIPMSIPKDYDVVDNRATKCHGGLAKVSPARYITQALVAAADDPKLRFVFANTHYVSGAWNGELNNAEEWRDRNWKKHFAKHREVLEYWRKKGYPVIWTGDVNRHNLPKLLPKYEKRAFTKSIDQIGWVRGGNGVELKLERTRSIDMDVDSHKANVAIMKIRRGLEEPSVGAPADGTS